MSVGQQRGRVLGLLRDSDRPLDAHELAAALEIHPTTVRFHLSALVDEGKVAIHRKPARSVGRPRLTYEAVQTLSYATVVGLIAVHLGGTPAERESKARAVGSDLAAELGDLPADDVGTLVETALARLGFKISSVVDMFGTVTVHVCTCPLVDIAKRSPEVVRGIQQGLIQAVVDRHSADLRRRYDVNVVPDPTGGECEVRIALAPVGRVSAVSRL